MKDTDVASLFRRVLNYIIITRVLIDVDGLEGEWWLVR